MLATRGQGTKVLAQEVKHGVRKAPKTNMHAHQALNQAPKQSVFGDGQVEYEIESLNDEEPSIKIQLSQTNQTLGG